MTAQGRLITKTLASPHYTALAVSGGLLTTHHKPIFCENIDFGSIP